MGKNKKNWKENSKKNWRCWQVVRSARDRAEHTHKKKIKKKHGITLITCSEKGVRTFKNKDPRAV